MRLLTTAVLAALLAGSAMAQAVSETVDVHILEVEAVVIDRQGKAVLGLTQNDFEVFVNGSEAAIANFYPVQRGTIAEAETRAAEGARPAVTPLPRIPTRLIVFVDDLHLRRRGKKRALEALKKYVSALDESATAMIVRWDGSLTVRVPQTNRAEELIKAIDVMDREAPLATRYDNDRRSILRAIDTVSSTSSVQGGPPPPEDKPEGRPQAAASIVDETLQSSAVLDLERQVLSFAGTYARQTENTIGALRQVVEMAQGMDGRKVILYVSEGLPLQPGAEVLDYWSRLHQGKSAQSVNETAETYYTRTFSARPTEGLRYDQTSRFLELVKQAQEGRVIFSSIDPAGVRGFDDMGAADEGRSSATRVDSSLARDNERSAVRMVAEETGGRYFADDNDLDVVMDALADQIATYYSLGVRAPSAQNNVAVTVRVKDRKDVRVLTSRRRHSALREEGITASVRSRLYSREAVNPLGVRLLIGTAWPDGRGCRVPVHIVIPAGKVMLTDGAGTLAVHAVVLDDAQRQSKVQTLTRSVRPVDGGAVTEVIHFGLRPSRYIVSIAIVDQKSGEISYIQAEIDTTVCG